MHGPLEAGAMILGDLRLQAPLDAAQPHVWRAVDGEGTLRVVKWSPAASAAFVAQELAALRAVPPHPGVVALVGEGRLGEGHVVVTAWVPGDTLEARLRAGDVPLATLLGWLARGAEGLDHLHTHGVVHRDAKAANLRVADDGRATWVDLGLASTAGAPARGEGSGHTMAPEQVRGDPPTPATDVYALGVLLYRGLAGRYPFHARNPAEQAAQHLHAPVPALPDAVPGPLAELTRSMLAKAPVARPSARQVALALSVAPLPPTGPSGVRVAAVVGAMAVAAAVAWWALR